MKILKQDLDFNAAFRALKQEIKEEVNREIIAEIIDRLKGEQSFAHKENIEKRPLLRRVTGNEQITINSIVECPGKCGTSRKLKTMGFHLRSCLRRKGKNFVFNNLPKEFDIEIKCPCGKDGTHLDTDIPYPTGVVTSTIKAIYIHHLASIHGKKYISDNFRFLCKSCSTSRSSRRRHAA